jgi:RNA polymerase sigma-70 factor (ECF subfamily)
LNDVVAAEISRVFRREYGRAVAVLVRQLRDISIAEEAVQDAFTTALARWPVEGIPPAPAGWIITTARHRAIDRLRREASRDERQAAAMEMIQADDTPVHDVHDDRLRLIFTCCHPALSSEAQVALTLRLLGGLATPAIARAFLVAETTLGQRISRAKAKIRDAGIPYRVPDAAELPARLRSALTVVYLIFNEGYSATSGDALVRGELCDEAIRLGRLLVELLPNEPETLGLLALMLLVDARRDARVAADGKFVRLEAQDRALWDRARIAEGQTLLRDCLRRNRPGVYQLQATIQAVHSDAADSAATDWRQILEIYDALHELTPTAVIALNRAVVVAEIEGAAAGLKLVESLDLDRYQLFHAVRADLLRRIDRFAEAAEAYQRAIAICGNEREREFMEAQLEGLKRN